MALQSARIGTLIILGLAACTTSDKSSEGHAPAPTVGLSSALSTSASKAKVPRDLLVAIAKVEDGLSIPATRTHLDVDNDVPAAGPLQLRRGRLDTLRRGAELTGASELDLRANADLALEAGALVLAELGAKSGARLDDLTSWNAAIEEMSGYADAPHREAYAHRVFATLARGGTFDARDGEKITLPQHELPPSLTVDLSSKLRTLAEAEYEGAEWIPTSCDNKCVVGRDGVKVDVVIIHDTEGNWEASVATLQNDPKKSVQYIVGVDGRVAQFVPEDTTAWHAGNSNYNQRSVGIEHVGYSDKPFAEPEYAASAKLVDYLANKYGVPRDRAHIIGHDQVPNGNKIPKDSPPCSDSPADCHENLAYGGANNHTDPGIWEWATFMDRFGGAAKCNDVTERWSCSNDKTKAFRCAGSSVELQTCDGAGACEPAGDEADAVCHLAPKAETPKPAPPPSPVVEPKAAPPAEDSGCAVSARSYRAQASTGASASLLTLAFALAFIHTRRRRSAEQ